MKYYTKRNLMGKADSSQNQRVEGTRRRLQFPLKAIISALAAALLMKLFLFDFVMAEGYSMVPAINPGKVLLVSKLSYGFRIPGSGNYLLRWAHPRPGDIVVFYTPLGEIAVKRCGELSGEDFYALGDNSLQSYDSRSYGPVPVDNIIGRVLGIK